MQSGTGVENNAGEKACVFIQIDLCDVTVMGHGSWVMVVMASLLRFEENGEQIFHQKQDHLPPRHHTQISYPQRQRSIAMAHIRLLMVFVLPLLAPI